MPTQAIGSMVLTAIAVGALVIGSLFGRLLKQRVDAFLNTEPVVYLRQFKK